MFGHPSDEVIKRLKSKNCEINRTDQMGEIILTINSINLTKTVNTTRKIK